LKGPLCWLVAGLEAHPESQEGRIESFWFYLGIGEMMGPENLKKGELKASWPTRSGSRRLKNLMRRELKARTGR